MAHVKTGKSVKYAASKWVAMDMKTYKAERTQLLKEVREKVIGKYLADDADNDAGLVARCINGFKKHQLEKLKELEEGK